MNKFITSHKIEMFCTSCSKYLTIMCLIFHAKNTTTTASSDPWSACLYKTVWSGMHCLLSVNRFIKDHLGKQNANSADIGNATIMVYSQLSIPWTMISPSTSYTNIKVYNLDNVGWLVILRPFQQYFSHIRTMRRQ